MTLNRPQVLQILTKKLNHENFDLEVFSIEPLQAGSGMMGEHLRLECHIILPNNKNKNLSEKQTHLFFIKKESPYQNDYQQFARNVFLKEVDTYKLFQKMNHSIISQSLAELYFIDDEHMVFNDLVQAGYNILNPLKLPNDNEIIAILHSLARIHAASIILEENMKQKHNSKETCRLIDEFPEAFNECYMIGSSSIVQEIVNAFIKGFETGIDIFELKQTLKNGKIFKEELQKVRDICDFKNPSEKFRNVVCHCDLWAGNLFVRNSNGNVHAKIIDYQITRYLPPAMDVLYVLLFTTSRKFRTENGNFERLQREYFHCFSDCLRSNGVDPNKIYTWEEFLLSFKEIAFLCIFSVCVSVPLVSLGKENFAEMPKKKNFLTEDKSLLFTQFKDNEYFISRTKDTFLELQDYFENN